MAINLFGGMPWITQAPSENLQRAAQLGLGTGQLFGQSFAAGQRTRQEREELGARTQEAEARLAESQRQFNLLGGLRKAQMDQAVAAVENYKLDTELKAIQKQNEVANKQGLVHLFTLQKDTKGQGWTPENRAKLFAIGEQYPSMATHPYYKDIWDEIQEVDAGKQKLADQLKLEQQRLQFTVAATGLTTQQLEDREAYIRARDPLTTTAEQANEEWFKLNIDPHLKTISGGHPEQIKEWVDSGTNPNEYVLIVRTLKDKSGKITESKVRFTRQQLIDQGVVPAHREEQEALRRTEEEAAKAEAAAKARRPPGQAGVPLTRPPWSPPSATVPWEEIVPPAAISGVKRFWRGLMPP